MLVLRIKQLSCYLEQHYQRINCFDAGYYSQVLMSLSYLSTFGCFFVPYYSGMVVL